MRVRAKSKGRVRYEVHPVSGLWHDLDGHVGILDGCYGLVDASAEGETGMVSRHVDAVYFACGGYVRQLW
jgi:hypothetical protein